MKWGSEARLNAGGLSQARSSSPMLRTAKIGLLAVRNLLHRKRVGSNPTPTMKGVEA